LRSVGGGRVIPSSPFPYAAPKVKLRPSRSSAANSSAGSGRLK
jgi:hypothetical protein